MSEEKCMGCGGKCCTKIYLFFSKDSIGEDQLMWWRYHEGVEVDEPIKNVYRIKLPIKCSMLDENLMCKVHGTDEQPQLCKEFDCGDPSYCFDKENP